MNRRHFFLAAGAVALSPALPAAAGPVVVSTVRAAGRAPLSANAKHLLVTMRHLNATAISQPEPTKLYNEIVELRNHGLLSEPTRREGLTTYDSIEGAFKAEDRLVFDFTEEGQRVAAELFEASEDFDPYSVVHLSTTTGPSSYSLSAGCA